MTAVQTIALFSVAGALVLLCATRIALFAWENRRCASVEGKFYFDTRRIVWRVVNTGRAPVNVVEIGLLAGSAVTAYRPLFSMTEEINIIPNYLIRADVGNYRKEMDRFGFKPADVAENRDANPFVYFYVKDAFGRRYKTKSDVRLLQYAAEYNRKG